jgi:hypothetical protein
LKAAPEAKAAGGVGADLSSVGANSPGTVGTLGICSICPPALGSVCAQAPWASNKTQQVDHLFASIETLSKGEPLIKGFDALEDASFY